MNPEAPQPTNNKFLLTEAVFNIGEHFLAEMPVDQEGQIAGKPDLLDMVTLMFYRAGRDAQGLLGQPEYTDNIPDFKRIIEESVRVLDERLLDSYIKKHNPGLNRPSILDLLERQDELIMGMIKFVREHKQK